MPFLGYFAFRFKDNIIRGQNTHDQESYKTLGLNDIEAVRDKLIPTDHDPSKRVKFGLVGNGWRGQQLLESLGYIHPDQVKRHTADGKYDNWLKEFLLQEPLNIEFAGVCDTFSIHAQLGVEISSNEIRPGGIRGEIKPAKIYPTYREMVESSEIDAIIIATPDHTHAAIAIAAAKAGKHVFLEKPMAHTIDEAVELRNTIRSTGIIFQLGHENRQQLSFKMAREMYLKGVLGDVSMVETNTNRNGLDGAWIRKRKFDHLGNVDNINWKEFLGKAAWHEFDPKRYFNWQRFSDYGTSVTGNDFSHMYDCVNQILDLGIPDSVMTMGGQYYYKNHGDMPDVINAIFSYPERGLTVSYNGTLKSGVYRQLRILGSEASMDIDRSIMLYKDDFSERYKEIQIDSEDPLYYYAPNTDADAVTSATARSYVRGGYGPTFIDGKVIDATYLHLKEWLDAIHGQGKTSCHIDAGFEEAVTCILSNLSYQYKKPVGWDAVHEKVLIG